MDLRTERLTLRRVTEADVDLLVELDSDPKVMRWLNGGHPTSRDHIERVVLPRFARNEHFVAFDRRSGRFIGRFSIADGQLGYRLLRSAWGHGLATEGAREMIRYGFEVLGFDRISAGTYEHNTRSRRVMEKCGMTFVAKRRPTAEDLANDSTFEVHDTQPWPGDDVEYAITKPPDKVAVDHDNTRRTH